VDSAHKHAVTHLGGVQKYWYDANGNMTKRIVGADTFDLSYDNENHLTQVKKNGSTLATFVYDGDGKRVKGTVSGVTTACIGNHFEWTGSTSTMKKYYYAGGQRVAVRRGSGTGTTGLSWLLGDHLGSTAITASSSGAKSAELRYKAWGETRYTSGATPTDFRYTGQRFESLLGLHDYGARWYDSLLGRWLQPDSIVPLESQGVQAWDRFAYANNNPVRYNDPTGHCIDGITTLACITVIAMGVGAIAGGAYNAYTQYQETGQVDIEQVATAALGGAVVGGGLVIGAALVGAVASVGASALAGAGAAVCADGDCTNEVNSIYRGLAQGENPANGLVARAPGIGNSPISHVAGKIQSQWISTTKDVSIATEKFGKYGVVEINLTKITSPIVDYSKGIPGKEGTMLSNWAQKFQEVLIQDFIPPNAITGFIQRQ